MSVFFHRYRILKSNDGETLDLDSTFLSGAIGLVFVATVTVIALYGGRANKEAIVHQQILTQIEFSISNEMAHMERQKASTHRRLEDLRVAEAAGKCEQSALAEAEAAQEHAERCTPQFKAALRLLEITRRNIFLDDQTHPVKALMIRADINLARILLTGIASFMSVFAGLFANKNIGFTLE